MNLLQRPLQPLHSLTLCIPLLPCPLSRIPLGYNLLLKISHSLTQVLPQQSLFIRQIFPLLHSLRRRLELFSRHGFALYKLIALFEPILLRNVCAAVEFTYFRRVGSCEGRELGLEGVVCGA